MTQDNSIQSVSTEKRMFAPSAEFVRKARFNAQNLEVLRQRAAADPDGYWAEQARALHWDKPFTKVLEWNEPFAKWFSDGLINASTNCLDRHLETHGNKAAIIFEGEPGDIQTLTYRQLHRQVCKAANVLTSLGIKKGDRVGIYLPMVPEIVVAMLACARIGATHSVVFGGFSAEAVRDRMNDAQARLIITADGGWRRGTVVPLRTVVEEALREKGGMPTVENVLTVRRTGEKLAFATDVSWEESMRTASQVHQPQGLEAEHPLFILYTSGTTGKPKGVVHSTGGYLTGVHSSFKMVFDVRDSDVYWCTADAGWITGHSYMVYGPLSAGATVLIYEGAPMHPHPARFWEMIERHQVTLFYTAPTAIRAFMRQGEDLPHRYNMESLRLLGSVGEPINPEAWMWYQRHIGNGRCPIVDTWWQTETGGIMISPVPGAMDARPGSCTRPLPGIEARIVKKDGTPCAPNEGGYLAVARPWPSMLRTVWGDNERYQKTYWSEIPHHYFAGDGARTDEDGYFHVMGRIDDVVNVSGHRLGTAEVESALVSNTAVAESAVVSRPDELKGNALVAFVTLKKGREPTPALKEELRAHVAREIGAFAKPDEIRFTDALPKTRSGKIMRRLLRELATTGEVKGDVTTLEDLGTLARLRTDEE